MRRVLAADAKPLHWVGSSKRDFLEFPEAVKDDIGNALGIAQFGGTAPTTKPWQGLGPGVLEVVESHQRNAYRAVYTVRFPKAVYVVHAFQKKSPSGIRTACGARGSAPEGRPTRLRGTPWQVEKMSASIK